MDARAAAVARPLAPRCDVRRVLGFEPGDNKFGAVRDRFVNCAMHQCNYLLEIFYVYKFDILYIYAPLHILYLSIYIYVYIFIVIFYIYYYTTLSYWGIFLFIPFFPFIQYILTNFN